MPTDKPLPTVADLFINERSRLSVVDQMVADRVRLRARMARKFVLDDEGTRRAADIILNMSDLIVKEQQFARPPFDLTWLEFDYRIWWETVNQGSKAKTEADDRIGYLFDHGSVYVISENRASKLGSHTALMPMSYTLHRPWEPSEQAEFASHIKMASADGAQVMSNDLKLDIFFWGSSVGKLRKSSGELKTDNTEMLSVLRNQNTCNILPLIPKFATTDVIGNLVNSSSGELRNIVALALLLNRPSVTRYVHDVASRRTFHKGKLANYMAHTVVTIDVDPVPEIIKTGLGLSDGLEKRRHEVRGHYCHNYDAREYAKIGCIHDWKVEEHPDDDPLNPDHWQCSICHGKRWWRHEHVRGNSQLGYVNKTYKVG